MSVELKKMVAKQFSPRLSAIGFAPVERFVDAPEKHHPANTCKDAQTVIVLGITVSQGMLRSPDYNLHLLHRSYHLWDPPTMGDPQFQSNIQCCTVGTGLST